MTPHLAVERKEFFDRANIELKRAERYRVFLSLICLDLSFARQLLEEIASDQRESLRDAASDRMRVCDYVALLPEGCLALLYPETNRDGAELAARRVTEAIRDRLSKMTDRQLPEIIPMEIASFPDAAGTRTVPELLDMITNKGLN